MSDCLGSHYRLVVLEDIAIVQVYARESLETRNNDLISAVFCGRTLLEALGPWVHLNQPVLRQVNDFAFGLEMRVVTRWTNGSPVLRWSESGDGSSLRPAPGNDRDEKREVNAVTLL